MGEEDPTIYVLPATRQGATFWNNNIIVEIHITHFSYASSLLK